MELTLITQCCDRHKTTAENIVHPVFHTVKLMAGYLFLHCRTITALNLIAFSIIIDNLTEKQCVCQCKRSSKMCRKLINHIHVGGARKLMSY